VVDDCNNVIRPIIICGQNSSLRSLSRDARRRPHTHAPPLVCLLSCYSLNRVCLKSHNRSDIDKRHRDASTPVECQKACEFDPRCVAVDWSSGRCELNTDPNHTHYNNSYRDHYDLVSRCNITLGQCFHSNVFTNNNLLKLSKTE